MWLVDLNYNFEYDWPVELSDNKVSNNKLSDNNLASELLENRSVFKPITIEEIVIFMIKIDSRKLMLFFKNFLASERFYLFNISHPGYVPIFKQNLIREMQSKS